MSETASAVVAVGASAGGVGALTTFVRGLPLDLRAGVVVVLHVPPEPESLLPRILARAGPMPVAHARDGEPIVRGHIYVAPPDCHVLVRPRRLQVVSGPRVNLVRPAVDPLFRTAAASYGPNAIAVVLSGSLDDGASGARAVAELGGTVIVQEPRDARFPGMPEATIAADHPDHVLPAAKIAPLVAAILSEPPATDGRVDNDKGTEMRLEARYTALEPGDADGLRFAEVIRNVRHRRNDGRDD
jgi:two-component system, chemotaxis family, protein-glutamate methylesterase/glutaminase